MHITFACVCKCVSVCTHVFLCVRAIKSGEAESQVTVTSNQNAMEFQIYEIGLMCKDNLF